MPSSSRARRLSLAVLATVSVATLAAVGPTAPRAHAAPTAAAATTSSPIQHVVVIYQENHSFDEVLGALCIQDARCDGSLTATLLNGTTRALT